MKRRRSKLRRRYGRQHVGTLSVLRNMEAARRAYRAARAAGRTPRSAQTAAYNATRHYVGAGAWDLAVTARREAGE